MLMPPIPASPHGLRLQPVFSDRKVVTTVALAPGHSVLLLSAHETEETQPFPSAGKTRRLAILITARPIDVENPSAEIPAPGR